MVKSSYSELDNRNKKLQEILYKNNINDIDDLVVTTNNKKEGFFESKSISSKQIDYPDVDVNNANNYLSKINFNENQSNNNGINII